MRPREHAFRFRQFMLYLDLEELPTLFEGTRWFSIDKANLASFRREDYLGPSDVPLREAVARRVEEATGRRPAGPIRLLTHLRYFGYVFNPVSFYYCFDESGERVETIVAEITNTPWKERHAYVLRRGEESNGALRFRFEKAFYVSPFMPMEIDYDWSFTEPGEELFVHMNLRRTGEQPKEFDATMSLERRPMTARSLNACLLRYPLMTTRVIARIYVEALRLRLKGVPSYPHESQTPKGVEARS